MSRGWMGDTAGPGCDADVGPDEYEDWIMCETCAGEGVNGHDCGEVKESK